MKPIRDMTDAEFAELCQQVARQALQGFFNPDPLATIEGPSGAGSARVVQHSAFIDMTTNPDRVRAANFVQRSLSLYRAEGTQSASDGGQRVLSPGHFKPQVQIDGGAWVDQLPAGFNRPSSYNNRAIAMGGPPFEAFRVYYFDGDGGHMGYEWDAHGLWSLPFFDDQGVLVNDRDEDAFIKARPYRFRFVRLDK
ncbi:MAG TPA: hypothetical protein VKZ18_24785 [Polyangia bacterium]|nr:hypothetical protein [Polyangia bacterium]